MTGWSERTNAAAQNAMSGKTHGLRAFLPFVGPAVIASVAYMDPGNFATNIQAGAKFGYELLWVVVAANLIAMLFQGLSAKLGIASGRSLATVCRDHLPRPLVICMWIASEMAAMATDLAEFLGGAIGLSLLFHLPLLGGLALTGLVTYAILVMQGKGFRPMEAIIGVLVLAIGGCYLLELVLAPLNWPELARGAFTPTLRDGDALLLAVGIVGATVMPHAIYLHSGLMHDRVEMKTDAARRKALGYSNREVIIALSLAGLVNMAMIAVAASVFHASGRTDVAEIETAYQTLTPLLGAAAGSVFLISLLASGLSSSVVGTMAGQVICQDFVHMRIPLWLRRVVTMAPAFVVVAMGVGSTQALIMSQVLLSLFLPVPMAALIWFTSRRDVMGNFVNSRPMTALAIAAGLVVFTLNSVLLVSILRDALA